MIKRQHNLAWLIAVPLTALLAITGCATKKYARAQVAPVRQQLAQYETQTNDKIATVWNQQKSDMSQVNERLSTTELKLSDTTNTASRAMQQATANSTGIQANATAISTLASGVANAMNYKLVDKADVMFGFNKSALTPQAKTILDQVVSKVQAQPRSIVELAGFTDKIGSKDYNLALSRRRAEAVQRYLVRQNVPLRAIHIIGLGEEAPPQGLEAEAATAGAKRAELNRLARRVQVQIYGAGDIIQKPLSADPPADPSAAPPVDPSVGPPADPPAAPPPQQ